MSSNSTAGPSVEFMRGLGESLGIEGDKIESLIRQRQLGIQSADESEFFETVVAKGATEADAAECTKLRRAQRTLIPALDLLGDLSTAGDREAALAGIYTARALRNTEKRSIELNAKYGGVLLEKPADPAGLDEEIARLSAVFAAGAGIEVPA